MASPGKWPFLLSAAAIRHPWWAIALMACLALGAAPGLVRLELRTDGHALVPPDDPAVALDAEVRATFGLSDPIAVIFETRHPEKIYNRVTLAKVIEGTELLKALPGIDPARVVSLATEKRARVWPGTFDFQTFLEPPPDTAAAMRLFRLDVADTRILAGTLISLDERATAILVGVPDDPGFDRPRLYRQVVAAVAPLATAENRVSVVGAPVAEAMLGDHVLEDLALLLPLAFLVIAAVMWLGCRRWLFLALAVCEIGAVQLFTFGLMGWTGSPVYLTTAILPVILTTICLADEIHLFWRYQKVLAGPAGSAPPPAGVLATLDELARPVALTSLTTAVGFFSFLGGSITAVRGFGVFAGVGILFSMLWTLTVVPASLALIAPGRLAHPRPERFLGPRARGRRLVASVARPRRTLVAVAAATVVFAAGIPLLAVQDSWIDAFAPESRFRSETDRANALFHGTHLLRLALTFERGAGDPEVLERRGPLLDPKKVEAIGALETFVEAQPGVGGVLGPHDQLTTVAFLWLARREELRKIPEDPARLERVYQRYEQGRGLDKRREVVDDGLSRAVVTVFLKAANFRDTAKLMAAIREWAGAHLAPLGGRLEFAGDVAVSQAMIPAIVETQVSSVLLAPLSCLLVIALLYRSLATGTLAVLPAAVAVVWVFGAMGWLGIPLGVATSMFCAITLGIAVDYAIHFLERWRRARADGAAEPVALALRETGPPILADTAAIAAGFGVLALSQVPANARLGLLVAAALIAGACLTLFGLGSLLALKAGTGPAQR
ncbi:MAG TPA: MMPL family transporter [Thermoanaerobaculia bacterium]|nr:MMPL family transporter [Thermoanaerobaculia bacterium]